jgi:uncharacterized integral membrane protein (TIGR00697 family)
MNFELILIGVLAIILNYGLILLAFKLFGKLGLYICVPIMIIIANIQVVVAIDFFTMAMTLGNVAYVSSYLITDLLGELYGEQDAKYAVRIGFFTLITMVVLMNVMLLSQPFVTDESTVMYESINNIFSVMPRIMFASMIAYFVSQSLDVIIYSKIKAKSDGRRLWFRNNVSTVTSQVVDGLVFTFIAFYNVYEIEVVVQIFITTFIIKAIIATLDTPFMYLGVLMKKNNLITEYKISESEL